MDFGAPVRVDVPFLANVVHAAQQFGLGPVAVQADQRRVGADHPTVQG
jgi:hypothetical protein